MPRARVLSPESVWNVSALKKAFASHEIKELHATKLWNYLIQHPDADWSCVPDLPKAAVQLLTKSFSRCTSQVVKEQVSADGETVKLLIRLQDGLELEAVIMHYDTSRRYQSGEDEPPAFGNKRATLCVSSQVGCQMGCTFCATGTMGLIGNITSGEIVEQLYHALKHTQVRNVVFMGMGEPLNNYDQVKDAVQFMTDSKFFGLSKRHVTVSTVGVVPRILSLATDLPGVSLALSLHAPTQELRQTIVPSARAYKLDKLMDAIARYQRETQQRVFVEYVLLAGVNDQHEHAHQLGKLLQDRDVVLNVIPWNPVYTPAGQTFAAPAATDISSFQSIIRSTYGVHCTVRQEKGQDIAGACGQLALQPSKQPCTDSKLKDIEDLDLKAGLQTSCKS